MVCDEESSHHGNRIGCIVLLNNDRMTDVAIDYDLIKQWLRRGEIKELAELHGISTAAAYSILKGGQKNFDFVFDCYEKALERAMKVKAFNEKLTSAL